jgi:hypothetical protein
MPSVRQAPAPAAPATGADNFTRLVPADWPDRLQLTRNQRPPGTNTTTSPAAGSPGGQDPPASPTPAPQAGTNLTDPPGNSANPGSPGSPGTDNSGADSSPGPSSTFLAAVVAPTSLVLLLVAGFVATRRALRRQRGAHQRLPSSMSADGLHGFGDGPGAGLLPRSLSRTLSWVSCCISRPLLGSGYYDTIDGDGTSSAAGSLGHSRRATDASGGAVGRHLATAGRLGLLEEGSESDPGHGFGGNGPLSREEEAALERAPLLPRLKYHTMPACPAAMLQKMSEAAAAAEGQQEVPEQGGGGSPSSAGAHLSALPVRLLKTWGGQLVGDGWELPSHLLSQLARRRTVGLPPLEPLPPPITARWAGSCSVTAPARPAAQHLLLLHGLGAVLLRGRLGCWSWLDRAGQWSVGCPAS